MVAAALLRAGHDQEVGKGWGRALRAPRSHLTARRLHFTRAADQDAAIAAPSHGDPPVTSRHFAPGQLARQRSRPWGASHAEVDSLQAAMDDFQVCGWL